jgi:hypothetical protein
MKIIPRHSKSLVLLATSALILLPLSADAVEFTISGQVNRLIMAVDNGVADGIVHADNSVSGTRWRIKGHGDIGNDMTAGLYFENQLQSNPSDHVSVDRLDSDGGIDEGNLGGGNYFSVRQANVWLKGNFGKATIGQGSGAADGSAEVDLSGTTVVQYAGSSNDLLGSMEYGSSGITVREARTHFDGLGRSDNLRYDGASGPVAFAASVGNGSKYELSAGYKVSSLQIMAGYWDTGDSIGITSFTGQAISASWLGGSGFNVTGSYGTDDSTTSNPSNIYVKVGYKKGNSAYGLDYSVTSDESVADASAISVAWVNNIMKGIEVYASYRVESLDNVAGADDISALIGGGRVKF